MNDLIARLFGLERLRPGDAGVGLELARPLPGWGWLLVVLAAGLIAGWSYWRLVGPRPARAALATLRAGTLVLLAFLIAGPRLVRPSERVERDWVVVLVDRSASMTIADVPGPDARGPREAQLRSIVERDWPAWRELARDREVLWLGFDAGTFDLADAPGPGDEPTLDLGEPDGQRTSLGRALEQALRRVAARPVAGVVVLSDGRSDDEVPRGVLRRLGAEQVPVFAVALGSAEPVTDLAVASAEAPALAFVRDTVPVRVEIERLGALDASAPAPDALVRLVDRATELVLDERPLRDAQATSEPGGTRYGITLTTRPDQAGSAGYEVRVVPREPDLSQDNNSARVQVELVDRSLRVLYADGYPRWEYRYLKNLLLREPSLDSASLLLAADRRYIQEGDILLPGLPASPAEWDDFDVVILGDVRAELFSPEQLEQIRDLVAVRGAGLIWIGGGGATPGSWKRSALEALLPFSLEESAGQRVAEHAGAVTLFRAPAAERLGLFEMEDAPTGSAAREGAARGWPRRLSDPRTGWSRLFGVQRIDPGALKPTAEVLAWGVPESDWSPDVDPASVGTPVVMSMRFGAGRVLYVGTDEIWRWRYGRGEALHERFWLPLVRLLGREGLARAGRAALIEVSPRRAELERPVRVTLRLLDQALADARPPSLSVRLTPEGLPATGEPGNASVELRLTPAEGQEGRTFGATWVPPEPGRYRVEPSDALLSGLGLSAVVEVFAPDDELRRPETDHEALARLASETGGRLVSPEQSQSVLQALPNRRRTIALAPESETLWDRPVVLVVLMALLTLEWVGRRVLRLA